MRRVSLYLSVAAVVVLGVGLSGCGKTTAPSSTNTPVVETEPHGDDHDHGDHDDGDHDDDNAVGKTAMDKMKEGLANLSEADRESAMKQHMCPVSGEMLGTMGEPIKVTVKDQEVWICCEGCKEDLLADPDNYLAKIKK